MTNKPLLLSTCRRPADTLDTFLQAQSSATAAQTAASTVSGVVRDQMMLPYVRRTISTAMRKADG
jgi:hypothetical protein